MSSETCLTVRASAGSSSQPKPQQSTNQQTNRPAYSILTTKLTLILTQPNVHLWPYPTLPYPEQTRLTPIAASVSSTSPIYPHP